MGGPPGSTDLLTAAVSVSDQSCDQRQARGMGQPEDTGDHLTSLEVIVQQVP
jgi:hypothetical protein